MQTLPKNPQEPKAYSYVRFSSPAQAEGDSLRRQQEASARYATKHGLTLDDELKADTGVSAYRRKNALKGNLAKFLKNVEDGIIPPGSILIVENLDRLSRAPILESTEIIGAILRAGIDIVTLSDGLRHRAADIRQNSYAYMMPVMSLCRAFEESKNKSERVGAAWASKRNRARTENHILTARGPVWLTKTLTGWEAIPERVVVIQRIFDLALQGWGKYKIVRLLNDEQIPVWPAGKRKAKGWHPTFIARLWNERKVLGEIQPGKTTESGKRIPDGPPIVGYYPAIIDEAVWLKVNQRTKPSAGRPSGVVNLFQGLLRDGYTAAPMRFVNKGKKEPHHSAAIWLVSDSKRLGVPCSANWPYLHFENLALKFLRELDWAAVLNDGKSDQQNEIETKVVLANAELARVETAQSRTLEALRSSETPPVILAQELERLQTEATRLTAEIAQANSEIVKLSSAASALAAKPILPHDATPELRLRMRAEIRKRVKAIHLYTQGLPTPEGLILTPQPSIEIEFANGVSRFVITGTATPFPAAKCLK